MTTSSTDEIKLLSILHYVMGGLMAAGALVPVIHLSIGLFMASGHLETNSAQEEAAMQMVSSLFIAISIILIIVGMTLAICILLAGRFLSQRTHHTFCFVIACIQCVNVPLGTALGVFTIITLNKPEVKATFGQVNPL